MSPARLTAAPLLCPRCAAEIAWDDVSERSRTARCWACHRVIDLTGGARVAQPEVRERPARLAPAITPRARLARPASIQLQELPNELQLEAPDARRPLWLAQGAGLAGAAAMLAVMWFLGPDGAWSSPHPFVPVLLGATVLAAGWMFASAGLNRLRLVVRRGELTLGLYPFLLPGRARYAAGALTQLYVEERKTRSLEKERTAYALMGLLRNGERVELVPQIREVEEALFLEQALERALKITDVPVPGEVGRARQPSPPST